MTATVNVVCLGFNPWSPMWKRVQQIVAGLSREPWVGRALFLNPDAWGASLLFDYRQTTSLMGRNQWRAIVPRRPLPNVTVFTPFHLPLEGRFAPLRRLAATRTARVIGQHLAEPFILIVNRPEDPSNPLVTDLMRRAALRVFDWSDDFETFADTEEGRSTVRAWCEHFIRQCDVTIAVNDRLGNRARALSRSAHVVRNGTDLESFGRALAGRTPARTEVRPLPHPMIGYVGYRVHERLDLELIDFLARSRPAWSFVFVGPAVGEEPLAPILARRSNVHVFGPVDYQELPSFVTEFDVCILPNRVNAHTAGNDPIKLYDYLAAGKPIVSTRVAGADMLGDMVQIADAPEEFLVEIEKAIAHDSAEARARRHAAAEAHSWESRVRVVSAILREALADKERA